MAKKKQQEVTLVQVAEELNSVMQYGIEDGKVVAPEEIIDVELREASLLKKVKECAQRDLRASDEEDFSPEVWQWFINNGLNPAGEQPVEEDEPKEKPAPKKAPAKKATAKKAEPVEEDDADDEADEPEEEATPKAKKAPAKKEAPAKKPKQERGPSNEQIAIDIVKDGGGLKEVTAEFKAIYEAKGKDDPKWIAQRANIYYNIACKANGIEPEGAEEKPSPKKTTTKSAPAKGKASTKKADPVEEDEEEEKAPPKARSGRNNRR